MKIELRPDEKLLKEDPANLQRGLETVGGRLFLTDSRLVFVSHRFNVQSGPTEIALSDVHSVRPCWTKFLGLLPLLPNSLAVTSTSAEHRFVVFGRSAWAQAIQTAASQLASNNSFKGMPLRGTP